MTVEILHLVPRSIVQSIYVGLPQYRMGDTASGLQKFNNTLPEQHAEAVGAGGEGEMRWVMVLPQRATLMVHVGDLNILSNEFYSRAVYRTVVNRSKID